MRADRLYRFHHAGDDEVLALQGVSLTLERGELVAVTGPSGSGKSTLVACLTGLDDPDGGTVTVAGQRLSRRPEADRAAIRARHIGVVFQHGNLLDHLDLVANIALAQRLVGHDTDTTRPTDLLESLGLVHRARAVPAELSGGELARAGLAVALANAPEVVVADEPTGELDGDTEATVLDLLRARCELGAAVLVVTHSPRVAASADRRIQLADGKVTQ